MMWRTRLALVLPALLIKGRVQTQVFTLLFLECACFACVSVLLPGHHGSGGGHSRGQKRGGKRLRSNRDDEHDGGKKQHKFRNKRKGDDDWYWSKKW